MTTNSFDGRDTTAPKTQPEPALLDRDYFTPAEREKIISTLGNKRVARAVAKVYGIQIHSLKEAIERGRIKDVWAELGTDLSFLNPNG
ncbi:MAG: hypothetical protein ACREEI_02865 [Stellaceae bacterium]